MSKPFRIIAIVLVVLLLGFFGFRKYIKSFSPSSVAEYNNNGVGVKVTYSQPGKKGRLVFGREQDNALVPYGKVWRTGANEATVVDIDKDVMFAGKPVKAGSYSLWTIPGQSTWKIILNSETGQWGTEYNDGKDVITGEATLRVIPKARELFKIDFEEQDGGVNMILSWDQTEAVIPITKQ